MKTEEQKKEQAALEAFEADYNAKNKISLEDRYVECVYDLRDERSHIQFLLQNVECYWEWVADLMAEEMGLQ